MKTRDAPSLAAGLMMVLFAARIAGAQTQVAQTVHNLSASGPGKVRANREVGACVFCHTPHTANPTRELWNREMSGATYKLYQSSTMMAQVGQPTGSSRLCLSCHDGILALSKVRTLPQGDTNLAPLPSISPAMSFGTDLSNDHPISFVYNSALALKAGDLLDPSALPRTAPLDETKQMQCTSCHDPHDDSKTNFLRIDLEFGKACTVCHREQFWRQSSHATSSATWRSGGSPPWPANGYPDMAENACLSCHRVHEAPHPARLLAQPLEEQNCTICHNGVMTRDNMQQEFMKPSRHPMDTRRWVHDPAEDPLTMPRHVTCADCHNPHAASASAAPREGAERSSAIMAGPLLEVSGVTLGGASKKESAFEYEICLKCHGINEPSTLGIVRQELTRNIRLRINPGNRSIHPIAGQGKNRQMTGLMLPYNVSSILACTDCHNNDQSTANGQAPRGPHGSRFEPILAMEYETADPLPESYSAYALCYKCHDRGSILFGGGLNGFPHKQHVVDQQTSCAVCHDSHGSRQNLHLIDFMTMAKQGNAVVKPSKSGRLQYVPDPARPGHGSCYLKCHGSDHNPKKY